MKRSNKYNIKYYVQNVNSYKIYKNNNNSFEFFDWIKIAAL